MNCINKILRIVNSFFNPGFTRKFIISGYFLCSVFTGADMLYSQETGQGITGVVRDGITGLPLENVNIIIVNTSIGTASDKNGRFALNGLNPGEYNIRATMVGYEPLLLSLQVNSNGSTQLNLDLQSITVMLDSVGIIGNRRVRDVLALPELESRGLETVQSTVSFKDIQRQGSRTVIDAMKYIPGGLTESRGRKVKQFLSVRGQKYPYPDYAINGIWQKEFHELPFFISASDIESIEIIRSSAALLTGLSGLAGVINLKTKEFDSMETALGLDYGSYGTFHSHLSHGGRFGGFGYATGLGYDRTSGPAGMHAAEKMINISGRFKWEPDSSLAITGNIFYLNGMSELRKASPPATLQYIEAVQSYDPVISTITSLKAYYRPRSFISSELQLYYTGRKPVFVDEARETKTNEYDFEWGINFIQSISVFHSNKLRFGGLYNHWLAPNGKRFYTGRKCDTETLSFVLVDEYDLGHATLDAGIRWARTFMNEYGAFNIDGEGQKFKEVDPITDEWQPPVTQGSIGFTYDFNMRMSIHMHASYGQIKPREGSLDSTLNVPANESRMKFDLGILKNWANGGKLVISPFYVKQLNAIVYSGQTYENPVTGKIMELYENRDQEDYGVEIEINSPRMLNFFSFSYNLTLMNSSILTTEERVMNKEHPVLITNAGIYLTRAGFDLNLFAKYVSEFESVRFANLTDGPQPLGNFFTMDITGGYTFGLLKSTRLYVNIFNVTDKKYSTVVGYPDFGRQITVGVRFVI